MGVCLYVGGLWENVGHVMTHEVNDGHGGHNGHDGHDDHVGHVGRDGREH